MTVITNSRVRDDKGSSMMRAMSFDLFLRTLIRLFRRNMAFLAMAAVMFGVSTQGFGQNYGTTGNRQPRNTTSRLPVTASVEPQSLPPIVSPDNFASDSGVTTAMGYDTYGSDAADEVTWVQYQDDSEWASKHATLPSVRMAQGKSQSSPTRVASVGKNPPPATIYQGPGRVVMEDSDGTTPTVMQGTTSRTLRELNPPSPSTTRNKRPANDSPIVNAYDTRGDIEWNDAALQQENTGNYEILPRQLGHVSGYGTGTGAMTQDPPGMTEYVDVNGMIVDPYTGNIYGNSQGGMYDANIYGGEYAGMYGGYNYGPGMYGYPGVSDYGSVYTSGLISSVTSHILCSNVWENLSVGFGASSFKSPLDLQNGGAFGFSETLNWASPSTMMMPVNIQAGFRAVQAFPSGYQDGNNAWHRDHRKQSFGTIGFFRRNIMCSPFNFGMAYDMMNEKYINEYDLEQVRAELSYGGMYGCEFGYRGAFGLRDDTFRDRNLNEVNVYAVDYHTLFVKKYFANGGEGSLAGGATKYGDILMRAEYSIPLSNEWGLKNSFSYVVPKGGHSPSVPQKESWDVSLQLVYQPRGGVLAGFCNPFRAFFDVADNGTVLQRTK